MMEVIPYHYDDLNQNRVYGMNMEPFEAYSYYLAIKLHFESDSYDAPKYNFKTSANHLRSGNEKTNITLPSLGVSMTKHLILLTSMYLNLLKIVSGLVI